MQFGPLQILVVLLQVVLLFGRGKISALMTDLASGIKGFRKGLQDDEQADTKPAVEDGKTIDVQVNKQDEKTGS